MERFSSRRRAEAAEEIEASARVAHRMGDQVRFRSPEFRFALDGDLAAQAVGAGHLDAAFLRIQDAQKRPNQQRSAVGGSGKVHVPLLECEGGQFETPERLGAEVPAGADAGAGKGAVVKVLSVEENARAGLIQDARGGAVSRAGREQRRRRAAANSPHQIVGADEEARIQGRLRRDVRGEHLRRLGLGHPLGLGQLLLGGFVRADTKQVLDGMPRGAGRPRVSGRRGRRQHQGLVGRGGTTGGQHDEAQGARECSDHGALLGTSLHSETRRSASELIALPSRDCKEPTFRTPFSARRRQACAKRVLACCVRHLTDAA